MMTTKSLNSIAGKAIFSKALRNEPMQEAPGDHKQIPFERGYTMFDKRSIVVMFK